MKRQQKFANLPINAKLRQLQAVTVGMALVFTLLISTATEFWKERSQILDDTKSTGHMIGFNAGAALLFNDSRSATDILAALRSKPHVIAAQLYSLEGSRFADYVGEGFADFVTKNHFATIPESLGEAQLLMQLNRLEVMTHTEIQKVYQNAEITGYLYLVIDLRPMWWGLANNLGQISLVTLVAFLMSAFYGRRLAFFIADPVIRLSLLAEKLSKEKDYTVRAIGEGKDEIGQLVKSFNQMIEQVQERDAKLEQQRGLLEYEVEVRTADLRNSANEAQAANIAKSQFLATMSHEIRTPMNGVLGMTELLLTTDLSLTQRQYADTIITSAEALLNLINDILDFSKIEAGKLELEEIDFNLPEMTDYLMGFFFERAYSKKIGLSCSVDDNVPSEVRGDPYRLRQILTNLLSNAIKFTNEGSVKLHVSMGVDEPCGNPENGCMDCGKSDDFCLVFCITDTGIGIRSEAMSRLFKSFSQADGSTTRKYGGSGLGLVISKELTELMGGQISVDSVLGEYTTFTIVLPLRRAWAPVAVEPLQDSLLLDKNVLVVEDNPTNAKILTTYLQSFGMNCRIVENAMDALKVLNDFAARNNFFDFALLDMKMQDMNGADLCQLIREEVRFAKMQIIIITSSAYEGELSSIRSSGCDLYLYKPLRKRILQDGLLSLIAEKPSIQKIVADQQNARILLAEDNPINQEIVIAILKVIGCQVEIAENGIEAVELFKKGESDLILMDCMMPEMDGYMATKEIRSLEKSSGNKRIPILALTANAMEGDKEKCLTSGMDDYLPKPISIEALRQKVIKLLNAKTVMVTQEASEVVVKHPDVARFDPSSLNTLRNMGGAVLVSNLLQLFKSNALQQIEKLQMGMLEKNHTVVLHSSHTLKSIAANVGALYLAQLAREIEYAAHNNSLVYDETVTKNLMNEYEQVLHIITQQEFS